MAGRWEAAAIMAACAMAVVVFVALGGNDMPTELAAATNRADSVFPALKIADEEERHANRGDDSYRPKIAVTFERARSKMLQSQAQEDSAKLRHKAAVEDREASALVGAAKELAQKMVQREAMDEMRRWMRKQTQATAAQPSPAPQNSRARRAHLARVAAKLQHGQQPAAPSAQTAPVSHPAVGRQGGLSHKTHRMAHHAHRHAMTETDRIRAHYRKWHRSQLRAYGKEHHLYSASEFCNMQEAKNAVPTVAELRASFGDNYKDVVRDQPALSQLAVVSACLKALGPNAEKEERAWQKPALKGKETLVSQCAGGNDKACGELAKDPAALSEMKQLLPPLVVKAVAGK